MPSICPRAAAHIRAFTAGVYVRTSKALLARRSILTTVTSSDSALAKNVPSSSPLKRCTTHLVLSNLFLVDLLNGNDFK